MFQEAVTINQVTSTSKKCWHCGMRNFADTGQCKRCKSDLSLPLNEAKKEKQLLVNDDRHRSKFSSVFLLIAVVGVLSALVFVFTREGPQAPPVVLAEAVIAKNAGKTDSEHSVQPIVEQDAQSEAAAVKILSDLKHFQAATESDIDYDAYERKLNGLKASLNETLTSFVRHQPGDETFRQEVAAAVREYTAAGNWWKTTITNSTVFSATDRNERTQKNFESARMHLTNAEKILIR